MQSEFHPCHLCLYNIPFEAIGHLCGARNKFLYYYSHNAHSHHALPHTVIALASRRRPMASFLGRRASLLLKTIPSAAARDRLRRRWSSEITSFTIPERAPRCCLPFFFLREGSICNDLMLGLCIHASKQSCSVALFPARGKGGKAMQRSAAAGGRGRGGGVSHSQARTLSTIQRWTLLYFNLAGQFTDRKRQGKGGSALSKNKVGRKEGRKGGREVKEAASDKHPATRRCES